jgi:hypothetical protein
MLQINKYIYNLKCLILQHIIKDDVIEEYSIDKDLLHDYYNEEPEWSNDRD